MEYHYEERSVSGIEHILVIGAGLAGLALSIGVRKAGYQVTVLERNAELEEIGAGVQLPANSCRILSELGVLEEVRKYSVQPQDMIIRSYRGPTLYTQNLSPSIEQRFQYPHLLIHRADLRRILYEAACAAGVNVQLGKSVIGADFDAVTVRLASGEKLTADLIVGTDGEHSILRECLLRRRDPPRSSGDVVYRIALSAAAMEAEPELKHLKDPPSVHAWYGPGAHAVCYQLRQSDIFNVVLTLPEPEDAAAIGPRPADLDELRQACKSWDPRFRRLLDLAKSAQKWTLLQTNALRSWNHPNGRFILLGDAAHATLPYLAQGAALSFESTYILSLLLARHPSAKVLPRLLDVYSQVRMPRAAAIRARSKHMHDTCQLFDGLAQIERDRILREEKPSPGFPNPWADPEWADFMWNFDAVAEAARIWRRIGARL